MDITLPSTLNKGTRRSVMSLKTAFQLHVTLYYEKTAGVGGIIKDMKTMKKPIVVTTLIVLSALFVCCSKSPEEKIEIMIGELVKNNLYIPEICRCSVPADIQRIISRSRLSRLAFNRELHLRPIRGNYSARINRAFTYACTLTLCPPQIYAADMDNRCCREFQAGNFSLIFIFA